MATTDPDMPETDIIAAAVRFINSTSSHIFLTGKAGTGKTTFLRNLSSRTHKQLAIVAPTGIAALNAGGVTIHSQFLFPFGMFMPDSWQPDPDGTSNWFTPSSLARSHSLNSVRKQVLRSIDVLVIDEVSMLRADLLDAIDFRLRTARDNYSQRFGGVQLLMIGDLYQLPPVVRNEELQRLQKFYKSPWFFDALSLQEAGFVYIELDKIFRQNDDVFIDLLNNLRNNQVTAKNIDDLNKHFKSAEEIEKLGEIITLTTHNYKAEELNQRALAALPSKSYFAEATIEGDFLENLFPVLHRIELKVGAQIMFVKNDNVDRAYFNGKLATVSEITGEDVYVSMSESHKRFKLKKEVWENKRYTVNADSKELSDEVIGRFEQYPVKLAWAITVHKSQGLTFDNAIIDVAEAFTDGQVYVALSRLRSLDGLVLRSRISQSAIRTNDEIVSFSRENNRPAELLDSIKARQSQYIHDIIQTTFSFAPLLKEIDHLLRRERDDEPGPEKKKHHITNEIRQSIAAETKNLANFCTQLNALLQENSSTRFLERIKKGTDYYKEMLGGVLYSLLHHIGDTKRQKRVKAYLTALGDLDHLITKKYNAIDKAFHLLAAILSGGDQFNFTTLALERGVWRNQMLEKIRDELHRNPQYGKNKKRGAKGKGGPSTSDVSLRMLDSGMSVLDISKERGLAISTIEVHLAKAVEAGRLNPMKFVAENDVIEITAAIKEMEYGYSSKDLYAHLKGKYSYGIIRAIAVFRQTEKV